MKTRLLYVGIIFFLALTACGRGTNDTADEREEASAPAIATGEITPAHFPTTQTLNIAVPSIDAYIANDAIRRLEAELNAQGIGLNANLSVFTSEGMDAHLSQFSTRLVAGQGYDVFGVSPMHPLMGLITYGHLADIFPLINDCNHTQREDYFMHVLEALALNGRLYTFPLAFMHTYIGVNAGLPVDFLARFAAYESVNFLQLSQFFLDVKEAEATQLSSIQPVPVLTALYDMLHPLIDWNTRTMTVINAPFIDRMQTFAAAMEARPPMEFSPADIMFSNPRGAALTDALAEGFVFDILQFSLDPVNAFLPQISPQFVHYVPLAAECGALVVQVGGMDMVYAISATADGGLAFAFLRHMSEARNDTWRAETSLATPIRRDLFEGNKQTALRYALTAPHTVPFEGQGSAGAVDALIHTIIAQIERVVNQPVSAPITRLLLPPSYVLDPFHAYRTGETTATDAARTMQANIAHFLLQPHALEADAGLLEEMRVQTERGELPAVTLRVLANENFRHVIHQAETDMNRAWAEIDKPYAFVVELSSFGWEDAATVRTRLQTMLMAGQGYDLIFACDFSYMERNFAQAGFLHDINPFIEACPHTQRSDLFENVLAAYEINGRLYRFPLSFGFEWAAINTRLPQPFIDRFTTYDRISIGQMMAIYADLRAVHEAEFGHLEIGSQGRIGHPNVALPHVVGSFVDFENRIASFNDGRFAEFLENFRATFEGGLDFDSWITTTMATTYSTSFLNQLADSYVFLLTETNTRPTNALFTAVDPIFTHSIPVSDEYGRLRIPVNGGYFGSPVWGPVMFPTAGNGTLAWEFTLHLLDAFTHPRGRANTNQWGGQPGWGSNSLAIPIRQDMFEAQMRVGINTYLRHQHHPFVGVPDDVVNATDAAIDRMRQFIHEPVVIPAQLGMVQNQAVEDVQNFLAGIATAQATAQRIQDRVQLWLMEQ
ncbi:MAG: hypothetical protein FWC16_14165 [Defluviitaleaceae bacterium]|nr:hypothetical protein [Defluviitaleaceae bacterium]MCL2276058.1 hypothetical protein [Defluviitaleaceae bacterium]